MQLYVKIWDKTCRNIEVFPGAGRTIGEFDGARLNLGKHKPFRRALSYQAYISFLKCRYIPTIEEHGSDIECGSCGAN